MSAETQELRPLLVLTRPEFAELPQYGPIQEPPVGRSWIGKSQDVCLSPTPARESPASEGTCSTSDPCSVDLMSDPEHRGRSLTSSRLRFIDPVTDGRAAIRGRKGITGSWQTAAAPDGAWASNQQVLPEILHLPLLQLCVAHSSDQLQAQLQRASHADLLIFVSRCAAISAQQLAPQLRDNKKARWYAVGPATADAVAQLFGVPVMQPAAGAAHSEGLLEQMHTRPGEHAALFAAPEGRTVLLERLLERGVHVELIEVYQRQRLPPHPRALELLRSAIERAVYTASSVQLLHAVVELLAQLERTPAQSRLIVSAPRIEESALQLGFADVRLAASADLHDLVTVLHRTE